MTTTEPVKGLRAWIYKPSGGSSSNGGISSWATQVTIVGPDIPELFTVQEDAPAVELHQNVPGHICARPTGERTTWWMFGGTWIYSGDSRYPFTYPIPLHDRTESAEVVAR